MNLLLFRLPRLFVFLGILFAGIAILRAEEPPWDLEGDRKQRVLESLPASVAEARGRAKWLHEFIHGALQVMHRDFFGDGNDGDNDSLSLPSQSLDDVFLEMARSWQVDIRWLGVNATKGRDHEPRDSFEEKAAQALGKGAVEYETVEGDRYRFVGAIRLQNQCLKCHVPYRKSLEDRVAGLVISFPIKPEAPSP